MQLSFSTAVAKKEEEETTTLPAELLANNANGFVGTGAAPPAPLSSAARARAHSSRVSPRSPPSPSRCPAWVQCRGAARAMGALPAAPPHPASARSACAGALLTGAVIMSQELYIVNDETMLATAWLALMYAFVQGGGASVAEHLDDRSKTIEDELNAARELQKESVQEMISKADAVRSRHLRRGSPAKRLLVDPVWRSGRRLGRPERKKRGVGRAQPATCVRQTASAHPRGHGPCLTPPPPPPRPRVGSQSRRRSR